jgi:hypothetical protein
MDENNQFIFFGKMKRINRKTYRKHKIKINLSENNIIISDKNQSQIFLNYQDLISWKNDFNHKYFKMFFENLIIYIKIQNIFSFEDRLLTRIYQIMHNNENDPDE